jgi:hypothetical protein
MAGPTKKNDSFHDAEANGQIRTLPEVATLDAITEPKLEILDTADDFRTAIGNAQMEGIDHVIVTERLFKYLIKNQTTRYLTYGDPGVKVYKEGTKKECDKEDKMNAEAYGDMLGKRGGTYNS